MEILAEIFPKTKILDKIFHIIINKFLDLKISIYKLKINLKLIFLLKNDLIKINFHLFKKSILIIKKKKMVIKEL